MEKIDMEIVGKFIQLKRDEDCDLIQWYLSLKTFKPEPEEATIHARMRSAVDGFDRVGLMKLVDALWASFMDPDRDLWADRFHRVADLHEEFVRFFDCAPPQWMYDLEARKSGRVQYADIHHMHRTKVQAQLRHEAVVRIAGERGIALDLIGYVAPEIHLPDVQRTIDARKQAERDRKRAYRVKKAADREKGRGQVAAIPAETTEAMLRAKLAAAYATIETRDRQIAKYKSEAHLQPAREEAAIIAVIESAPLVKQVARMESQIEDLTEQLAEANQRLADQSQTTRAQRVHYEAEIKSLRAELAKRDKLSEVISARARDPLGLNTGRRN
ncbi:hypothetical protein [Reyranella massiliensis]|uniref:hypothetical protein n=1 Tax=Reyranella massiliensis TaxID=445220 RepID=UPI0002F35087|nr:hypothetical protein [Reyranella massiliensis]